MTVHENSIVIAVPASDAFVTMQSKLISNGVCVVETSCEQAIVLDEGQKENPIFPTFLCIIMIYSQGWHTFFEDCTYYNWISERKSFGLWVEKLCNDQYVLTWLWKTRVLRITCWPCWWRFQFPSPGCPDMKRHFSFLFPFHIRLRSCLMGCADYNFFVNYS